MAVETERTHEAGPRGPLGPPTEDGRRVSTAAAALTVTALALVLASLLNAQSIYKSVYNKPEGTQREVALAFAGPLREVSMALRLDRPRAWFEDAVGREPATIDTEIVLPPLSPPPTSTTGGAGTSRGETHGGEGPTSTGPAAPTEPEEPQLPTFTARDPMRLWIAGDSLVITPGYAVFRALGGNRAVEQVGDVDGRVATGLTRPDVFNWFRHVDEQVRKEKIDVVVVAFGGNDDHDYMTGVPEGVSLDSFGEPRWAKEYRRRVGGLMETANRAGALVVWLGLPITDDSGQSRRFRVLNELAAAEAARRPGEVAYVDMYSILSDEDGNYAAYLPAKDGQLQKVRADDGVHLERTGGDMVAREVVRKLRGMVDIWSWRKQ